MTLISMFWGGGGGGGGGGGLIKIMVLITLSMAHCKRIVFSVEKGNAVTYFCVFGTCMRPLKKNKNKKN